MGAVVSTNFSLCSSGSEKRKRKGEGPTSLLLSHGQVESSKAKCSAMMNLALNIYLLLQPTPRTDDGTGLSRPKKILKKRPTCSWPYQNHYSIPHGRRKLIYAPSCYADLNLANLYSTCGSVQNQTTQIF